jgi:hypothetical protein
MFGCRDIFTLSTKGRAAVLKRLAARVDCSLLVKRQRVPPLLELIGVLDVPRHAGSVGRLSRSRQTARVAG